MVSYLRLATPALLALIAAAPAATAQVGYSHDDNDRLIRVQSASGNQATYNYDAAGNLLSITNGTVSPTALSLTNFSPQQGSQGTVVTLQGQNFSTTASSNGVQFNGTAAQVLSATANTLVVSVPAGATTGPISVTVAGSTASSATNFTVVSTPVVNQVSPVTLQSGATAQTATLQVTGVNLAGSTFSFTPVMVPAKLSVVSAVIAADGASATLQVSIAALADGSFTVLATNASGSSSPAPTASNTVQLLAPDADPDGDGLTNAVEAALGTNPLNAATSGQGIADGWQVYFGLNPLSAASAGPDPGGSGSTAAQDFKQNLSPVSPNRVPPGVVQLTPAPGTAAPINSNVIVRFGEPLLTGVTYAQAYAAITRVLGTATTLSATSVGAAATTLQAYLNRTCCGAATSRSLVTLSGPFGVVPGTVAVSSDGLSLTFSSAEPLVSNTSYSVTVNGARDAAGNLMTAAYTTTFTTNAVSDSTVPAIKLVDPESGLTAVPTNAHYTVQFSKVMDPATLTPANFTVVDKTTGLAIAGIVQVDASGTTASFVPALPLPIARTFTVTLGTGITDSVGNPLATAVTYTFTTGYVPETAAPHLIASSPISGAAGIPTNAVIDLLFSQPIDLSKVVANLHVTANGSPVAVQMALSSGDMRITLTPSASLASGTQYTVAVGAGLLNVAGLALDNPGTFTFTTGAAPDTTYFQVLAYSPQQYGTAPVPLNAIVRVSFNKPVDVTTLLGGGFVLNTNGSSGSSVAGALVIAADQKSFTFTPSAPLLSGTYYYLNFFGVRDLEGDQLYASSSFLTGTASTPSGGPSVVQVSPAAGTTGVPVNALVQLAFNEDISPVQAASTITLSSGAQAISGTVSVPSSTTNLLQFTPSANLSPSTTYTVTVGGVVDVAGYAGPAFTSNFTTSSSTTAASGGATLLSSTPAAGATGVPVTTAITLNFSKAISPVSVNSASLPVKANGIQIAGTYAVSGSTITFTPATQLPGSATVIAQISTTYYSYGLSGVVEDLAGNNVGVQSLTFTTAATQDTTPPTVVSVLPQNGQTGVGTRALIVIAFSKSMNPATLTTGTIGLLVQGISQSFTPLISADNRTLTLSSLSLPASSLVTVTLSSAVTDLSGNALAPFQTQYTTGTALNQTYATVISQRPASGATLVATTASPIVLVVNKPLDPASISGNTVQVTQNGQVVAGTVALSGGGQLIVFTPAAPFAFGALVQVYLDPTAYDLNGNYVNAYAGMFTIVPDPSITAPVAINGTPMNNDTGVPTNVILDRQFSSPIDPNTVSASNVTLNGNSRVSATLSLDSTGTIVRLAPTAALAPNTTYYFYLNNLAGLNGLPVAYQNISFSTGAGPLSPTPTLLSISPGDGLTNVPLNAQVALLFSAVVDPLTVNAATVTLTAGGVTLPTTFAFSSNNDAFGSDRRVTVTPQAPLPASTAITLTVSGVTDEAGDAVVAQITHFTTGTNVATAAPGFLSASPANGAANVPLNATISLQANTPIDPTTVNLKTFSLTDSILQTTIPGTFAFSADDRTLYFMPSAPLPAGRSYTVGFNYSTYGGYSGYLMDLAGNPFTGCSTCLGNVSFTTGFTSNGTAPQVTAFSPVNGSTGVALNAKLQVAFSSTINPLSVSGVTLTANGAAVAVTSTIGPSNQLLTVIPTAGLQANTSYVLTVSGVKDFSGNIMTGTATSSFTTGAVPDLISIAVALVSPATGATGVPLNARIRFGFNKPINLAALPAASPFSIYTNGYQYSSYQVPGSYAISADGLSITFTPASNLIADSAYQVSLSGLVDLEGNTFTGNTSFTTSSTVQSAGPTVISVSPPNGTGNVPVNAQVELGFNEPVGSVVLTGAMTVSAGGQTVPGALTLTSPTTLLFTPTAALPAGTTYTVGVGNVVDLAGNAAATFSSAFTTSTSSTPSTNALTVLSFSPAYGSTQVPVNSPIVITFSAPMNPLTVNAKTISVTSSKGALAGTFAVDGAVVTFTPTSPLPASSYVNVQVVTYTSGGQNYQYPTDLAGNKATQASNYFNTAATPDTTAPTVVSVTPSAGQTGVGLSGQVVVMFSKSINPATVVYPNILLLAADTVQNFQISFSADNQSAILSGFNLPPSSVITLALNGSITDLSGNALAPYVSQFTTGASVGGTQGKVANQRPANGATGVSLTASPITLFLTNPLDPTTVNNSTVEVTQNGQVVSGTVALIGNGQTITFTPSSPWTYGALIQVFLSANITDTGGTAITAYQASFRTLTDPTLAAPAYLNGSPLDGATNVPLNVVLDLQYSAALDPSTLSTQTLVLQTSNSGTHLDGAITLDSTGTILHFTPSAPLTANTLYYFNAQGLRGVNGLSVSNQSLAFTTGTAAQTSAPTVLAVNPPDTFTNIPVNAGVAVLFSAPIDPVTFNAATVTLSGGGITSMPAGISFSNFNQRAQLTPEAPLPANTNVTFTLSGVTDVAGNVIPTQTTHFTTGSAAVTSAPGIVVTSPFQYETGVPLNATVSLLANTPIDPTTVTASTFPVLDQASYQQVTGTYSLSPDDTRLFFLPGKALTASDTFSVSFTGTGIQDVAGNALFSTYNGCGICLNNFTFSTGTAPSTTPPQVTGVSPAANQTAVPINAQIVVAFSEPVNAETLSAITLTGGGASLALNFSLSSGNQLLTIKPAAGFAPGITYTISVNGVADMSGNTMTLASTSSFTTGTIANPSTATVTTTTPANGATGVLTTAPLQVQFSKAIDALTATSQTVQLTTGGTTISATLAFDSTGTILTITPAAPLAKSTSYSLQLSYTILDLEGVQTNGSQISFTTGAN